jgi:hypothetical protein
LFSLTRIRFLTKYKRITTNIHNLRPVIHDPIRTDQQDEDAHTKRTQVATENLVQDFSGLFPALPWMVFPSGF